MRAAYSLLVGMLLGWPCTAWATLRTTSSSVAPRLHCPVDACRKIEGRLRSAGEGQVLAGVQILVLPVPQGVSRTRDLEPLSQAALDPAWMLEADTDADGRFELLAPPGGLRVVILVPGYAQFDELLELPAAPPGSDPDRWRIFVEEEKDFSQAGSFRTTVVQGRSSTADSEKTGPLGSGRHRSGASLMEQPGTLGDVVRALQSQPGVGRSPGNLSILTLRGLPPALTRVYYGLHTIPSATHIGGLTSVLPPESIRGLELSPGNYAADHGSAIAGVLVFDPRQGRRDGVHGHAYIDPLRAGAALEGPAGRGSFRIAAQRAWADLILEPVYDAIGLAGMPLASYYDYQASYDRPLPGSRHLAVHAIGAGDRYYAKGNSWDNLNASDDDPDAQAQAEFDDALPLDTRFSFHHLDAGMRRDDGVTRTQLSVMTGFDPSSTWSQWQVGQFQRRHWQSQTKRAWLWGVHASVERQLASWLRWQVGLAGEYERAWIVTRSSGPWTDPSLAQLTAAGEWLRNTRTLLGDTAAFSTTQFSAGPVALEAGVRVVLYNLSHASDGNRRGQIEHAVRGAVDPRLQLRIELGPAVSLRLAAGLYSQPYRDAEHEALTPDLNFVPFSSEEIGVLTPVLARHIDPARRINPAAGYLGMSRAQVVDTRMDWQITPDLALEVGGFYQQYQLGRAPTRMHQGRRLPASAWSGRSYGTETGLEYELKAARHTLALSLAYTWLNSTVEEGGHERPADFDIRHALVLGVRHLLPRDWRYGLRWRLTSASPFTPVPDGYLIVDGSYVPSIEQQNSERLEPYHQLDIRLDKTWTVRRVRLQLYLDVQNVYNRKNPEGYVYRADFSERLRPMYMPILPSLGLRLDF